MLSNLWFGAFPPFHWIIKWNIYLPNRGQVISIFSSSSFNDMWKERIQLPSDDR
jgi:hypothetical protein